jgi:hypothetical protein
VRADLRHQEDIVATVYDRFADDLFAPAVVVFPGIVDERDARIDRGVHDLDRLTLIAHEAEVVASKRERTYLLSCATKRSTRDFAFHIGHTPPSRFCHATTLWELVTEVA